MNNQTAGPSSSSSSSSAVNPSKMYPWMSCIMCHKAPPQDTDVVLLPCLHVICSKSCSAVVVAIICKGSPVECSQCKERIFLSHLKRRIVIREEFPGKKAASENNNAKEQLTCENKCDNRATSYCQTCPAGNQLLCDGCLQIHLKWAPFEDHEVHRNLEIPEKKLTEAEETITQKDISCGTHPEELQTLICLTCKRRGCAECLTGCNQHEIVFIEEERSKLEMTINTSTDFIAQWGEAEMTLAEDKDQLEIEVGHENEEYHRALMDLRQRKKRMADINQTILEVSGKEQKISARRENASKLLNAALNVMTEMDDMGMVNFVRHSMPLFSKLDNNDNVSDDDDVYPRPPNHGKKALQSILKGNGAAGPVAGPSNSSDAPWKGTRGSMKRVFFHVPEKKAGDGGGGELMTSAKLKSLLLAQQQRSKMTATRRIISSPSGGEPSTHYSSSSTFSKAAESENMNAKKLKLIVHSSSESEED